MADRVRLALPLLLSLSVALVACGGSGSGAATPTASATAEPTASAPAEPDEDDPAPRELVIKGWSEKPDYKPVVAIGTATFKRDGKVHLVLELAEKERSCATKYKAQKGDRALSLALPWEGGAKLDLSAPPPDENFNPNKMKTWSGSRWDEISSWKAPFGTVTVFEAPTKSGEKGRIRLKLRSGPVKMRGDLPVLLCVDAT